MSISNLKTNSRRIFLFQGALCCVALGVSSSSSAQSMVLESEAQASALGYKADATKVDKAKQAKYAAGQVCGNCALFQGAAAAASGGCPLFAGKQVSSKGWCTGYVKKGA